MARIQTWCITPVLLLAALTSCAAVPTPPFKFYEPAPGESGSPLVERIVVEPVIEARPAGGRSSIGAGFLAWIPLVPYGAQHFRKMGHVWDVGDGVGAVLSQDLRESGMSADVFHGPLDAALELPNAGRPYVVSTTIHEGVWNRNLTLYCISLAGGFLWMIGAPLSYGDVEFDFTLEVRDPDGEVLVSERFTGQQGVTEWPYGLNDTAEAFSELYASLSPDVRRLVAQAIDGTDGAPVAP